MSTIPYDNREEVLVWCRAHVRPFSEHAAAVGLSAQQVQAFAELTALLAAQEQQAFAARAAAEAATLQVNNTFAQLRQAMVHAVADVRQRAQTTGDERVYELAEVPPRKAAAMAPPPLQPTRLAAQLANPGSSEGGMRLTWQCPQPRNTRGTMYVVLRRLPGQTQFATIGIVGSRVFVDETLPMGLGQVEYAVQAVRGSRVGAVSSVLKVMLGVGGDGAGDGAGQRVQASEAAA